MDWVEICIHTSEEAVEAVSYFLHECGLEGVVIEDSEALRRDWNPRFGEIISLSSEDYPESGVRIKGYVSLDEDRALLVQKIHSYLNTLSTVGLDPGAKTITTKLIKRDDWVNPWKKRLHPIAVTDRILVKPIGEKTELLSSEKQVVIELDPGMAFGTGHHVTTIQSLQLLEKYLKPGQQVIDVGCGSGILSIAAAKLGAAKVLAIDLDPKAIVETKKHIKLNQLKSRIEVECGDGLKTVARTAHLIVANLIAEIHVQLVNDLPRVLVPGGIFIAAGILKEKEAGLVAHLQREKFQVIERRVGEEWIAIVAKK